MRQRIDFISGCFLFTLLIFLHIYFSYRDTGMLSFPLDDAFIHMAISKNLVQHGVWGITRFEFSSTSSSILYTLILGLGFLITGIKIWLPLLINYLAGIIILYLSSGWSKKFFNNRESITWHLLFVLMVPLAGMAVLGMEHTLQILFCSLFFFQTWKLWNGEPVKEWAYFTVALLAVMTRYESAFLIGLAAAAWLLVFNNWKRSVYLLIAVGLPIIAFGIYATSKGGFFFPNSLLAKSNFISGGVFGYFSALAAKILSTGLLFALIFVPLLYWLLVPFSAKKELKNNPRHLLMLLMALTTIAHFVLASFGWLFRYEAYLVALLFLSVMITWKEWYPAINSLPAGSRIITGVLGLLMLFPVLSRVQMVSHTKRATKNIADQQVQMAKLVQENFPGEGIAINDIGAICFFNNDIRILDMEGLGTAEVIRQKKQFDSSFLSRYVQTNNISIGIFYPHLYEGRIPSSWQQVGTWELKDNFVTGGSIVGFYVIDPRMKAKLVDALKKHSGLLPPNVIPTIHSD